MIQIVEQMHSTVVHTHDDCPQGKQGTGSGDEEDDYMVLLLSDCCRGELFGRSLVTGFGEVIYSNYTRYN